MQLIGQEYFIILMKIEFQAVYKNMTLNGYYF
jgi:hypothetical protein